MHASWGGWGAIAVRNLPQFTAILPQFFSDASIQKFHCSQRKTLSLPSLSLGTLYAVTRHTVRVCVLICPACHLCGRTLFCFCVPKLSSTFGDSDSGNGKRPVKCAKGQGGQKARYATQISLASRAAQYPKPDHPIFRKWLAKHTDINECIPTLSEGQRRAVERFHQDVPTEKFKGKLESILFDEYTS